jgi:hypothetical protein
MAELALRETLAYALDVERYREFLGASPDEITDEKLLKSLHRRRARSAHIPEKAKMESEKWLATHRKEE